MKFTQKQIVIAGLVIIAVLFASRFFGGPQPLVGGKPLGFYVEQLRDLDLQTQIEALSKIKQFGVHGAKALPEIRQLISKTKDSGVKSYILDVLSEIPGGQSGDTIQQLFLASLDEPRLSVEAFRALLKSQGPNSGVELIKKAFDNDPKSFEHLINEYEDLQLYQRREPYMELSAWLLSKPTPLWDNATVRAKRILMSFLSYEPTNIDLMTVTPGEQAKYRQRLLKLAEDTVTVEHGDEDVTEGLEDIINRLDPSKGIATTVAKLKALAAQKEIKQFNRSLESILSQYQNFARNAAADKSKVADLKGAQAIADGMLDLIKNVQSPDQKNLSYVSLLKIIAGEEKSPVSFKAIFEYAAQNIGNESTEEANAALRVIASQGIERGTLAAESYIEPVFKSIMAGKVFGFETSPIVQTLMYLAHIRKAPIEYAAEYIEKVGPTLDRQHYEKLSENLQSFMQKFTLPEDDRVTLLQSVHKGMIGTQVSKEADKILYALFAEKKISSEKITPYVVTRIAEGNNYNAGPNPWFALLKGSISDSQSDSPLSPLELYSAGREAMAVVESPSVRMELDYILKNIERQRNIDPSTIIDRLKQAVAAGKTPEMRYEAFETLISYTPKEQRKDLVQLGEKLLKEEQDIKLRAAALLLVDSVDPTRARIPVAIGDKHLELRNWVAERSDISKIVKSAMRAQPGGGFIAHSSGYYTYYSAQNFSREGDLTSEIIYINEVGVVECAVSLAGKNYREKLCNDPANYQLVVGPGTIEAFGIKPGSEVKVDFKLLESIRKVSRQIRF